MKILIGAVILFVMVGTVIQIYKLELRASELEQQLGALKKKREFTEQKLTTIKNKVQFLGINENIKQEIKTQLNYSEPNEKLIIIIQKK